MSKNKMEFRNLTFEKINQDADSLTIDKNDSFVISYPEFLKYFAHERPISKHDVIIASHFVYGWMPRMLKLRVEKKDWTELLSYVNKAKQSLTLTEDELGFLKKKINNSLVGVSKLLHFINPRLYPIWDSRVCRFLEDDDVKYKEIESPANYVKYLEGVQLVAAHKNYPELHKRIEQIIGHDLYPIRAIELVMFANGERTKTPKVINEKK